VYFTEIYLQVVSLNAELLGKKESCRQIGKQDLYFLWLLSWMAFLFVIVFICVVICTCGRGREVITVVD